MKRIWTILRSRRLAAGLLVTLTAYAWVSTLVPLASLDPVAAQKWDSAHPALSAVVNALGLHRAYSNPFFVAAVGLLIATTFACAWERSSQAWKAWSAVGVVTPAELNRLEHAPTVSLSIDETERDDLLSNAEAALEGLGMRTRRGPTLLEGSRGVFGLLGSPLFHWMLALAFLFAALGQLTRHEGTIRVVLGSSVTDDADAYLPGALRGGLFGSGYSGLSIGLTEINDEYVVGGIDRGRTPHIEVSSGGAVRASDWVYPNNPLVYGGITIHRGDTNPALVGTLLAKSDGAETPVVLYYDFGEVTAQHFTFVDTSTEETVTVSVLPIRGGQVQVARVAPSFLGTVTVSPGEAVPVTDNVSFTADSLTYYVTLRVVNDWSVRWIFAAFALGIAGLALTVFVPPRVVRVAARAVRGDEAHAAGKRTLRVTVRAARSDPAFALRVAEALAQAYGAEPEFPRKESRR